MTNALMVISPYWKDSTWVFDDDSVGLLAEPFVSGIPEMIDDMASNIPNVKQGFRMLFSAAPFPEYQRELIWVREEMEDGMGDAISTPYRYVLG